MTNASHTLSAPLYVAFRGLLYLNIFKGKIFAEVILTNYTRSQNYATTYENSHAPASTRRYPNVG